MFYLRVKCKAHSDQTETHRKRLVYTKGAHNSHKSRSQKRDMEQAPYWRPTNIRRHRKKIIVARATWPPGFVHLWFKSPASFSSRGKTARKGGHLPSFWYSQRGKPLYRNCSYLLSWCKYNLYVIGLKRWDKDCLDGTWWRIGKVWKYMRCPVAHECFKLAWLQQVLLTYLLTPWCRVLPEQLTGLLLVKKFPSFHGTRRFITAFTSVRHLSLSWPSPIQSIYQHPTSWRSILILTTHQ